MFGQPGGPMKITAVFMVIFLPALALSGVFEETRHFELSAEGIQTLKIHCGPGSLTVIGVNGIDRIIATGQIEALNIEASLFQKYLENRLVLSLKRLGSIAILQADTQQSAPKEPEAKINLMVKVPARLRVTIDDGSGPIIVTGLSAGLELDDDSGSIDIINVTGKLQVEDGSGSLDIQDVRGNVEVRDGSGYVNIRLVKGDVSVSDGSGSITIEDIDGNVTITDGSGSIDIHQVSQNVLIKAAGSGELDVDGIKGKVTVKE
jgi:hypothetical protein